MTALDNLRDLIILHNRRLQLLKKQQAIKGQDTPADIIIEIEEIEAQLEKLQVQLKILEEAQSQTIKPPPTSIEGSRQKNAIPKLFYSYAHEDEPLRDKLASHLKLLQRQNKITIWYDREIGAGAEREAEIKFHLDAADIILLLVSPDFMASDFCYDVEMLRAIERHNAGEATVIPVILRPTDGWKEAPFGKLQALPKNDNPVTLWQNLDEALLDIAQGVRKVAERLIAKAK